MKKYFCSFFVVILLAVFYSTPTYALPAGFTKTQVVSGLNQPTAIAKAPDGRIFILEKGGAVNIVKDGALLPSPFLTLPVNTDAERGLLGIAFDPDFSTNNFIYFYYVNNSPLEIRVSRFTASGNTTDPGSEQILLRSTQPLNQMHHAGTLRFGPDGKLWISVGNNLINPNSQDLSVIHGKLLRINKDGTIPCDNPFMDSGCQPLPNTEGRIWAYGFRNPFRFNFLPDGRPIVGDVGENTTEEINIVTKGGNYGWPNAEGPCASSCPYINPVFSYLHDGASAAAVGGFAKGSEYFYGDYAKGFIRKITLDEHTNFVKDEEFDPDSGNVVDFIPFENNSFYFVTIYPGTLYKVSFGDTKPTAKIEVDKQGGPIPLPVNFSGVNSSGPQGQTLKYNWDFGDGTTSTDANPSHTYSQKGNFVVKLTVATDQATSDPALTTIIAGDSIPNAYIITPWGGKYNAGDTINYSAFAFDSEDGILPKFAYSWSIIFHHQTHIHPFLGPITGQNSGSFIIPDIGETSAETSYEIQLTVTDSQGLKKIVSKTIFPNIVKVTINSAPVNGLGFTLDGIPFTSPQEIMGVVGMKRTLDIPLPHQMLGDKNYDFESWSDGQNRTHTIMTPQQDTTYTANFIETPAGQGNLHLRVREFDDQGQPTPNFINGAIAKLTDLSGNIVMTKAISSADGNQDGWINFQNVSAGTYNVLIYKPGYRGFWRMDNCDGSGSSQNITVNTTNTEGFTAVNQVKVPISAGQTTFCRDVGLIRSPNGNLSVRVFLVAKDPFDQTGLGYAPVGGLNDATVKLTDASGEAVFQTTISSTDSGGLDGRVMLTNIKEGTYGLMAYKQGYDGFWKKVNCDGKTAIDSSIQNENTEGQKAAWNNNVEILGGRTNFCFDLGLLDTRPPTPTPTPPCMKDKGDADCNGKIDLIDFEIWRKEFTGEVDSKTSDFNSDGKIDLIDFEIWRKSFTTN